MANNWLRQESQCLKAGCFSDMKFFSKNKKVKLHRVTNLRLSSTDWAQDLN